MSASLFAAQEALYGKLVADAGVQAKLGNPARVYDMVPADAAFPYLTLGDATLNVFDTKDSTGFEQTVVLHAWSRARGRKETKDILQAVYDCLHRAELTVSGARFVDCALQSGAIGIEKDGLTLHGVMRFRVVVQH